MKRISRDDEKVVFELTDAERQILRFILQSYPMQRGAWPEHPKAPQPSPMGPDPELLNAELAAFKTSLQDRVATFLSEQPAPHPTSDVRCLVIHWKDADWLLQVLNEVRVGTWYALGCPDENCEMAAVRGPETWTHLLRLEFAGAFQGLLLHELESD
ncbi:MAG: hypothetical protein HY299_04985 [Verrucomicrobia bacterium]|nr:hypothetical protein [Verrucomicrobiota bacterium]